ncbi:MAG TPA: hypothetical protein DEP66_06730 [Acidimicrobiaceae bacterium]|nr:hypothetical protein [Acidimicrobiaceae bacterium]
MLAASGADRNRTGRPAKPQLASHPVVELLLATEADWLVESVEAALAGPDVRITTVDRGADVLPAVRQSSPDAVIVDFQLANMGGMAVCADLRLESGAGRLPRVPVLLLLDREADVFLARRCDADDWIVKPLDALTLQRALDRLVPAAARTT